MVHRRSLTRCAVAAAVVTCVGLAVPGISAATVPPSDPTATAPADPLGCADLVFDQPGLGSDALETTAAQIAAQLHADLHVRIEGNLDGDTDAREHRLETECSGWVGSDGLRLPDLLVVMVSPSERSTSIYYGEDFYSTLSTADSQIQEFVMNPRFKDGDVAGGLVDGLNAIKVAVGGGGVPQAHAPIYDPTDFTYTPTNYSSTSSSDGDGLPVAGIIGLIVLVLLVTAFSSWAKANGWATTSSNSGYRRSWSSSSSSRGFSSSSSHRSSSRRSSSSRHSGGGGSSSHW